MEYLLDIKQKSMEYLLVMESVNLLTKINSKLIIVLSVPTDVINLCRKIRIRKSRHYGGQAM